MKLIISYKREMYVLAQLNLSTAGFNYIIFSSSLHIFTLRAS